MYVPSPSVEPANGLLEANLVRIVGLSCSEAWGRIRAAGMHHHILPDVGEAGFRPRSPPSLEN